MNVPRLSLLIGSTAATLTACSGAPAVDLAPPPDEAPPAAAIVEHFVAHLSPKSRSLTFHRVRPAPSVPGFHPLDLNSEVDSLILDNDGNEGSGAQNTVELVTNSVGLNGDCPPGYQSSSFCGNVTLRHFYPQSLSHVFVQVTEIKDTSSAPLAGHDALNSDPGEDGLSATHGLWKYTGPGTGAPGVLGESSPHNAGTADWVFANPDNVDTWIVLRVVAAMAFTSYSRAPSAMGFINACQLGTSIMAPSGSALLPFPFLFWDQLVTSASFSERGVLTFGNVSGTASGANTCLPDESAPAPALFAFWDDLTLGTGGELCWAEIGTEPNRRFVVEWRGVDFASNEPGSSDTGSSLTFEAILSEGTNAIDLVYDSMLPPDGSSSTRALGTSATVGLQDVRAGLAPDVACGAGDFSSGKAYTFTPIP